jgi:hypothetical protein
MCGCLSVRGGGVRVLWEEMHFLRPEFPGPGFYLGRPPRRTCTLDSRRMCFTCLHGVCVCACVCSWACVEVPRYTFYAVNLFVDVVPLPLFFLRYNLFMVLYPSGISGEHGVVGCWGRA